MCADFLDKSEEKLSDSLGIAPISMDITRNSIENILSSNTPEAIYKRLKFFDNPPLPDKSQIQSMFKNGELPAVFISARKWTCLADDFNSDKNLLLRYGFKLLKSINGLISRLGGNTRVSIKREYMLSLLNSEPFQKKHL